MHVFLVKPFETGCSQDVYPVSASQVHFLRFSRRKLLLSAGRSQCAAICCRHLECPGNTRSCGQSGVVSSHYLASDLWTPSLSSPVVEAGGNCPQSHYLPGTIFSILFRFPQKLSIGIEWEREREAELREKMGIATLFHGDKAHFLWRCWYLIRWNLFVSHSWPRLVAGKLRGCSSSNNKDVHKDLSAVQ